MPKDMTQSSTGSPAEPRVSDVNRDDHFLLTFAIRWLPYGCGPDDEILIRFGLDRARYLDRLLETVHRHRSHIHPATAERLIAMCSSVGLHSS